MSSSRFGYVALLCGAAAVASGLSCGDDGDGGDKNILWLALDGAETRIRLVPGEEPDPY